MSESEIITPDGPQLWDQQVGETDQAYQAFWYFVRSGYYATARGGYHMYLNDLSPDRKKNWGSMSKVWERWYEQHNWKARAEAWDNWQTATVKQTMIRNATRLVHAVSEALDEVILLMHAAQSERTRLEAAKVLIDKVLPTIQAMNLNVTQDTTLHFTAEDFIRARDELKEWHDQLDKGTVSAHDQNLLGSGNNETGNS